MTQSIFDEIGNFIWAMSQWAYAHQCFSAILINADKSMYTEKERSKLAKEVIAGKLTTMVCHMLEVENNLGRSLVIDLSCGGPNKFRQVDHRSIESIIF